MSTFLEQLRAARENVTPASFYDNWDDSMRWAKLSNLLVNNAKKIERLIEAAEQDAGMHNCDTPRNFMFKTNQKMGMTSGAYCSLCQALDALDGESDGA